MYEERRKLLIVMHLSCKAPLPHIRAEVGEGGDLPRGPTQFRITSIDCGIIRNHVKNLGISWNLQESQLYFESKSLESIVIFRKLPYI